MYIGADAVAFAEVELGRLPSQLRDTLSFKDESAPAATERLASRTER